MFDNPVDSLPSPKKKYKPQKSLIAQAKSAAKRQGAVKSQQWHDLRRATSTMGAGAVAVRTLLEGVRARAGPGDEPEPEPNDALSQVERVSLFVQSSTLRSMVKTNKNVLKVMDLWWETALRSQRVFLEEPSPLADRSKAVLTREGFELVIGKIFALLTPGGGASADTPGGGASADGQLEAALRASEASDHGDPWARVHGRGGVAGAAGEEEPPPPPQGASRAAGGSRPARAGPQLVTRERFSQALFELADLWNPTSDARDYVAFLADLFEGVATEVCVWHARTCTPCMYARRYARVHPADLFECVATKAPRSERDGGRTVICLSWVCAPPEAPPSLSMSLTL